MRITAVVRPFNLRCLVQLQRCWSGIEAVGRGRSGFPAHGAAPLAFSPANEPNRTIGCANHNERRLSHEERAEQPPNRPLTLRGRGDYRNPHGSPHDF